MYVEGSCLSMLIKLRDCQTIIVGRQYSNLNCLSAGHTRQTSYVKTYAYFLSLSCFLVFLEVRVLKSKLCRILGSKRGIFKQMRHNFYVQLHLIFQELESCICDVCLFQNGFLWLEWKWNKESVNSSLRDHVSTAFFVQPERDLNGFSTLSTLMSVSPC